MQFANPGHWQVYDPQGRRKYLNEAERERFLAAALNFDVQARLLCSLLFYTGCRISEALEITGYRLDESQCAVLFRTLKRRKFSMRSVPIPPELMASLRVICSGDELPIFSMHRATAWRHVAQAMEDANIVGPMACCRGLRHGFAIHAILRGVTANLVQRWLGHASPITTSIYLDVVGVEERQMAARMW